MKFYTYIAWALTIIVLEILILHFKLATVYDAGWWAVVLIIYLLLHGVEGDEEEWVWLSKNFSEPFKKTYKYIFLVWATATWLGGSAESIYTEFQQSTFQGIGFSIGAIISLFLMPLLLTYLIRLVLPFFKKVHDKANK